MPIAAHAPLAACAPTTLRVPVVSIATIDLRAELKRCRTGEDDCITIECQCKRRHNLEGDYDSPAPTREASAARATCSPSSPGAMGGWRALAAHLRMVVWPRKFQPHLLEKYDGSVNLTEFLEI
jgi:hypothetical protein